MQIQAAAQRLKTFLELVNTLNYTYYKQYMLPTVLHFVFSLFCQILQRYLPNTRRDVGLWSTEGGQELYRAILKWYLSLDIHPEDIHVTGRQEVDRISRETRQVCVTGSILFL